MKRSGFQFRSLCLFGVVQGDNLDLQKVLIVSFVKTDTSPYNVSASVEPVYFDETISAKIFQLSLVIFHFFFQVGTLQRSEVIRKMTQQVSGKTGIKNRF